MHPFIISAEGSMYVDVATATNSCQLKNRTLKSPGVDPCTELETRGGVWRFDATKASQTFSSAERYATGIRNAEGFAIDSNGRVFVTQHGRDQLRANWPDRYKPDQEATLPSEELLLLQPKGDYGWPECYYDPFVQKLVLAPEYGGDGGKTIGACVNKIAPIAAYPAHWAPNAVVRYDEKEFPAHYRGGFFVAFHGSWDRAPYAQGGYNVVFQALAGDHASGQCEILCGHSAIARRPVAVSCLNSPKHDSLWGQRECRAGPNRRPPYSGRRIFVRSSWYRGSSRRVFNSGSTLRSVSPPSRCLKARSNHSNDLSVSPRNAIRLRDLKGRIAGIVRDKCGHGGIRVRLTAERVINLCLACEFPPLLWFLLNLCERLLRLALDNGNFPQRHMNQRSFRI
jgi:hypothetical protein